jgi:uncharacterized membrane protein
MTTLKILYTYGAMAGVFLVIDLLWLGVIGKKFYQAQIGHLMKATPNWPAALVFYALFLVGVLIFCVLPAVEKQSLMHAVIYGALFGFFTYMTYELTNLAVLKNWPFWIVPVDILWGVVLTTVVSVAGFLIAKG